MEMLVIGLVVLVLLALLAVPFRFPRVGLGVGGVLAVLGLGVYFSRSSDPFWASMFDDLSRSIGTATLVYASLWLGVAGFRQWAAGEIRQIAA